MLFVLACIYVPVNFIQFFVGEKEGASCSLKQSQDLLMDAKTENAQLKGKLQATESQVEALQRGKEEVS